MGGSLDIRSYDGHFEKNKVVRSMIEAKFQQDQESSAYESGHSYSGAIGVMPSGVNWIEKTFDSSEEAEKYITEYHNKWDKAMGVYYSDGEDDGYLVGGWCSS